MRRTDTVVWDLENSMGIGNGSGKAQYAVATGHFEGRVCQACPVFLAVLRSWARD